MTTYYPADFDRIASAVGVEVSEVSAHTNSFEAAAVWYRSYARNPERIAPSKSHKDMHSIAAAAKKLLKRLEVFDYRQAEDGPGNFELLEALASAEEGAEDDLVEATSMVGRLAEIFDGIDATRLIKRQAEKAAEDAKQLGQLLPTGHRGDVAINEWIALMMSLYTKITGRECGTSVIKPGTPNEGKADGPLIRFLTAAGAALEIELSPESWRGRIRDNHTGGRRSK